MAQLKGLVRRSDLLFAVLIFIILTFVFFWKIFLKGLVPIPADITVGLYFPWLDYKWGFPAGVPVKNPLMSDIPSLVYPWRMFIIDSLRHGVVPLWDHFYLGGMPLLANFQSAVFSLANIFFLFLPKVWAWSIGIIIQPFLTSFFTFLFLRHLRLNKIAAILGGLVFAFSGFSLTWLEYNVHGWTGMWLPILLLIVDKIIEKKSLKWTFLGGFILAFQIFAGYPQIVFYSLTAAGFYTLLRLKKIMPTLLLIILLVVFGILLSAVQWLPGYEAMRLSVRRIDPIASLSSGGFLPWQNLVTFLAPDFFGNPATYNFWGSPWYDNFALYVGILPLILAIIAIFLRRDRLSWFFAFLVFFSLLLALPSPISRWVADIGLYGVKSISARIIFLLDFSLAILAALGLDWLIACFNDLNRWSKRLKQILFILFTPFLFICGLWLFTLVAHNFFSKAEWLIYLSIAKRNLILPTLLFIGSALIFITLFLFKKFSLVWIIVVLSAFDLFRFGWKYLPFSNQKLIFPTMPVIEFLQRQEKPFRVEFGETIPQNMWMPYGLESAAGYDAMAPLRYNQFLGALRTGQANNPYGRVAQVENYDSPLFNLLNIKYVLAVKYDAKGIRSPEGKPKSIFNNPKFKLAFEDKTVQIYENKNVLPRAFLVHNFAIEANDQAIINQLLAPEFNLSKKLILEENPEFIPSTKETKQEKVEWLEYKPNQLKLVVESAQSGFVLLSNNFYPGWQAFINSRKTKIYRADFTFQAIEVPEGKNLVEFYYQPKSFLYGGLISGFTLVNLLMFSGILIIKDQWRKK